MIRKISTVVLYILIAAVIAAPGFAAEIHDAALKGNIAKVKEMIKKNPALLEADSDNLKKPLHYAAQGGHLELVKFLLEKGAIIDSLNKAKETPLNYACAFGIKEVVGYLLKKGADINHKARYGTPIAYALLREHEDLAMFMMEKGADVSITDENKRSLLHFGSWKGSARMLNLLIKKGLPVNGRTKDGRTPLQYAVMEGNTDAVNAFLKHNADVNVTGTDDRSDWWNPLCLAIRRGRIDVVPILLKAGASVDFKDKEKQQTPLHLAALKGYARAAKILLESGADPNAVDVYGKTPLSYAVNYAHKKTAKVLLNKGANGVSPEKVEEKLALAGNLVRKQFKTGDALIWYLGHSGWAIKTGNRLLIFDYYNATRLPDTPVLANGSINPEEIKDLDVTVWVSHGHGDHYDENVFKWKQEIPGLKILMGFKPEKKDENLYTFLEPNKTMNIDGMEVTTIKSNDSGVGFFIKVNGVNIFHPGDHANRKRDFSGPFKKEIDFLAAKKMRPDIFFAPVSGCGFGDLEAVRLGVYYTVKKLSPKTIFPMHGGSRHNAYIEFTKLAKKAGVITPIHIPYYTGDWFFARKGIVKKAKVLKPMVKKSHGKKKSCTASNPCNQ